MTLLDGMTRWARVETFEHGELCRVLNLDPASYHFDLPSTAYAHDKGKERVSGYVMRGDARVGTLHVAREGERFRDLDPTCEADRLSLYQTTAN